MSLPELVVFSVRDTALGSRYLSFTGPQRQLRCDAEEGVLSDLASFVVEPAENGLVHIRSRYENRYWVKASRFEPWLLSSAFEPVEDQYDEGCTLFRPALAAGSVSVSFIHVQSGLNVAMRPEPDSKAYNLCVEQAAPTDFNFINPSTSFIKLPKYVTIRGDNNMFLFQQETHWPGPSILTFNNSLSISILPTHAKNGDIRIKTTGIYDSFGRFVRPQEEVWILHPDNPELDLNDPLLLFQVVRSSPSGTNQVGIALRSRANNRFCKRQGIVLVANATSQHDRLAWLRLEDPGRNANRLVTVTNFRHAWVTRQDKIVLSRTVNNQEDRDVQESVTTTIQDTYKRTWNHSFVPLLARIVGVFNARIPSFTTSGQLVFPDTPTNVMGAWLETTDLTQQRYIHETFIVPPRTKATLRLVQTVAICHVPFSYRQADTLKFGRKVQYDLDDGLFILEYAYNLRQQIVPLTTEEFDAQVALEQDAAFNQVSDSDAQGGIEPDTTNNESSDALLDDMMKQDADQLADQIRQLFSAQDEMKPDASNDSDYQGQGSEAEEDMIADASDQGSDAQEEMKPKPDASEQVDEDI